MRFYAHARAPIQPPTVTQMKGEAAAPGPTEPRPFDDGGCVGWGVAREDSAL